MNNIFCSCVLALQENGNLPSEYRVSCSVYAGKKAPNPTLTQYRSSRYKYVGVKVFWWIWACIVQLITPILLNKSYPTWSFLFVVCTNVFVLGIIVIQRRLCSRMCGIRTVELSAHSDDVNGWRTIPAVQHWSWLVLFLMSVTCSRIEQWVSNGVSAT